MAEGNTRYTRKEVYNALTGKFQREPILNDIVNSTARTAGAGADLSLLTVSPASGLDMYPYYIRLESPGAITFAITVGSSTVAYSTFTGAGVDEIKADGKPITKISATSTMTVTVLSAASGSTYTATVVSERRPADASLLNQ